MANDFDPVAKIIEYWLFENNLTAGKNPGGSGVGNDLTASAGGVGYGAALSPDGANSLDLENTSNQWATIPDADLSADFPLKSTDPSTGKVSWAFWIQPESITTDHYVVSKWNTTGNKRSLSVNLYQNSLDLVWGYNAGANAYSWDICSIVAGQIYHVGIAVDGVAKTALARIYSQTAGTATTYSTTFGSALSITDALFTVGVPGSLTVANDYDGLIDELVVADSLLTATEFDAIRSGTFNQANPDTLNVALSMGQVNIAGDYIYQPFIVF